MVTGFGKLFDPFVDKVFQVVTVIMLYAIERIPIWVPLYYVFRVTPDDVLEVRYFSARSHDCRLFRIFSENYRRFFSLLRRLLSC